VVTPTGSCAIEDLVPGSEILTADQDDPDCTVQTSIVEHVFRKVAPLWTVRVGGREIRCTTEHPFYVLGHGWVAVRELRPGQFVRGHTGKFSFIQTVEPSDTNQVVYNIQVRDTHTFFIGAVEWGFSVWVHNEAVCELVLRYDLAVFRGDSPAAMAAKDALEKRIAGLTAKELEVLNKDVHLLDKLGKMEVAPTAGVVVKDGKWDYFFGRVKSNPHNEARSLQNLKDLEALGIKEASGGREQLVKLFEQGRSLPEAGRHVTEHGVTITRTVKVGYAGAIDVKYFYPGGDMTAIPEVSTIIPKIFKK